MDGNNLLHNAINICNRMDVSKTSQVTAMIMEFTNKLQKLSELNMDLSEYFTAYKQKNEIIAMEDFQNKMDSIDDDALTVYVSKAQLYKVYAHDNFTDFENDDITHYRKPEYGPIHEVVRDLNHQKFNIIINDDLTDIKILKIKTIIVEFIKKNKAFSTFTADEIAIYKYDDKTEFLVYPVSLENISEKVKLIDQFIRYAKSKNISNDQDITDICLKIEIYRPPCIEIEGARFHKLPSAKTRLPGKTLKLIDQLVSTSSKSSNQPVFIGNTFIIQNTLNNNNTTNNSNDNIKTLKSFYKFIYDTKPEWYKENKQVDFSVIESAYRKYFNDDDTSNKVISRQLNNKIFTQGDSNKKRDSKKLLIKYIELKKLCTI